MAKSYKYLVLLFFKVKYYWEEKYICEETNKTPVLAIRHRRVRLLLGNEVIGGKIYKYIIVEEKEK